MIGTFKLVLATLFLKKCFILEDDICIGSNLYKKFEKIWSEYVSPNKNLLIKDLSGDEVYYFLRYCLKFRDLLIHGSPILDLDILEIQNDNKINDKVLFASSSLNYPILTSLNKICHPLNIKRPFFTATMRKGNELYSFHSLNSKLKNSYKDLVLAIYLCPREGFINYPQYLSRMGIFSSRKIVNDNEGSEFINFSNVKPLARINFTFNDIENFLVFHSENDSAKRAMLKTSFKRLIF